MLRLDRRPGEAIVLEVAGEVVRIVNVGRHRAEIGIEADPETVNVRREELDSEDSQAA